MAVRFTRRHSLLAAIIVQALILGGLTIYHSDVVIFGEVLTLQTAPMTPQSIRNGEGLQLGYATALAAPGDYLELEQEKSEYWQPARTSPQRPACTDCRYLERLKRGQFGISQYACTPDEATRIERDLRMAALENGTSGHPLLVEIVVQDARVQRIRSVRVAP